MSFLTTNFDFRIIKPLHLDSDESLSTQISNFIQING